MPVTWSDEKLILLYCPGRGSNSRPSARRSFKHDQGVLRPNHSATAAEWLGRSNNRVMFVVFRGSVSAIQTSFILHGKCFYIHKRSGYSQSCSANSLQVENFLIRRAALLRMRSSVAHAQAAHIPARGTASRVLCLRCECVRAFKDWESYRCLFVFCSISCYNL